MKNEIIIYDYDASPCVRRVKIALIEKGIPYQVQEIDLSKMQQKNPAYLAINPNGLVPTLCHNGRAIFESGVINEYLEDQFPKIALDAPSLAGRIQVRQWQNHELAMAKIFRTMMYAKVMGPIVRCAASREEFLAKARQATENPGHLAWEARIWDLNVLNELEIQQYEKKLYGFIDLVEQSLEQKRYLVDDQFTFADIAVYPRLTMYANAGMGINEFDYPNVCAWIERIAARRSVRTTQAPTEKNMQMLAKIGLLNWLNRIAYRPESIGFKDKLLMKPVRKLLRKSMKLDQQAELVDGRIDNSIKDLIVPTQNLPTSAQPCRMIQLPTELLNTPITLYGYEKSPITERILLLLKASGRSYQFEPVDMALMEHKLPPFQDIYPSGELPVMRHGDHLICDSIQMAEYLMAGNDDMSLFSLDNYTQTKIRLWNAFDMGMHKEYRAFFFSAIVGETADEADVQIPQQKWAQLAAADREFWLQAKDGMLLEDDKEAAFKAVFYEKLHHMETALQESPYLVGDSFTYADLCLFTRIRSFSWLGLEECRQDFPLVQKWYQNVETELAAMLVQQKKTQAKKSVGGKKKSAKKAEAALASKAV